MHNYLTKQIIKLKGVLLNYINNFQLVHIVISFEISQQLQGLLYIRNENNFYF